MPAGDVGLLAAVGEAAAVGEVGAASLGFAGLLAGGVPGLPNAVSRDLLLVGFFAAVSEDLGLLVDGDVLGFPLSRSLRMIFGALPGVAAVAGAGALGLALAGAGFFCAGGGVGAGGGSGCLSLSLLKSRERKPLFFSSAGWSSAAAPLMETVSPAARTNERDRRCGSRIMR